MLWRGGGKEVVGEGGRVYILAVLHRGAKAHVTLLVNAGALPGGHTEDMIGRANKVGARGNSVTWFGGSDGE